MRTRKVVGWVFGEHMTSNLVIAALNMRLHTPPGIGVHHSDQGSQYTSVAFGRRCKEMGVPSIGAVGDAASQTLLTAMKTRVQTDFVVYADSLASYDILGRIWKHRRVNHSRIFVTGRQPHQRYRKLLQPIQARVKVRWRTAQAFLFVSA